MREALKVVVAVVVALALWFVFDGAAEEQPPQPGGGIVVSGMDEGKLIGNIGGIDCRGEDIRCHFEGRLFAIEVALDPRPAAVNPIEVKLVDVNECATGWARVSLDDGWVIPYPHPRGFRMPNWIDDAGIVAAFTRPDGRVAVVEMEATKAAMRPAQRIICRWAPLSVNASPAD